MERLLTASVQMPIRDGYSATHAIRTDFSALPAVRDVPIIAMTASAIQGDREKCQQAGMDVSGPASFSPFSRPPGGSSDAELVWQDYLAKPVKGKVLEKMLVKWALEGSRKQAKPCSPTGYEQDLPRGPSPAPNARAPSAQNLHDQRPMSQFPVLPETPAPAYPALTADELVDRLHWQRDTALAKSSETSGDRAWRRIHAEEMASSLRDDKLLALTGTPRVHRRSSASYQGPQDARQLPLTAENMQRLEKEGTDADDASTSP